MRYATPYTPNEVNYNLDILQQLEEYWSVMIEQNNISGVAFCMARDGKKFVERSIGMSNIGKKQLGLLKPNAIFEIGFLSKLFTSAIILRLIEEGKISLETSLYSILDENKVDEYPGITIGYLLSTLNNPIMEIDPGRIVSDPWTYIVKGFETGDPDWVKNGLKVLGHDTYIKAIDSGFGYTILGEVITKVSGQFAETLIMNEIVKPCEMDDTCFISGLTAVQSDRILVMNDETKEIVYRLNHGIPFVNSELERLNSMIPDTGGFVLSTTSDMIQFGNMLLCGGIYNTRRILSETVIEQLINLFASSNIGFYWGRPRISTINDTNQMYRKEIAPLFVSDCYVDVEVGESMLFVDPNKKLVGVCTITNQHPYNHQMLQKPYDIMWAGIQ